MAEVIQILRNLAEQLFLQPGTPPEHLWNTFGSKSLLLSLNESVTIIWR